MVDKSAPEIIYTEEELNNAKPCPNCLSRNLGWDTFGANEYFIECLTCGLTGPCLNNVSIEQAVEAWNNLPRREENAHG